MCLHFSYTDGGDYFVMALIEFIVLASSYCDPRVSSGAKMNCNALTAASRDLPLGSCIMVNDKVKVLIADLGPCTSDQCKRDTPHILKRKLDFSYGTVRALGHKHPYLGKVKYHIVECGK